MKAIKGFFDDYEFLGNFYPAEVEMVGVKGPTVEHVYQALKSTDPIEKLHIAGQETPLEAKKAGHNLKLRPHWEEIKVGIMEALVRQKFTRHKDLGRRLLETGDAYLEETNDWGDRFWGVYRGEGKNHLGRILMKIREELRASASALE